MQKNNLIKQTTQDFIEIFTLFFYIGTSWILIHSRVQNISLSHVERGLFSTLHIYFCINTLSAYDFKNLHRLKKIKKKKR